MPKHSLETLATISKLEYFGHIMNNLDFLKKSVDVRNDKLRWKIKKTVHKVKQQKYVEP
jgi:hypothetical protein